MLSDEPQYRDKPDLDTPGTAKLIVEAEDAQVIELSTSERRQELEPERRHELAAPTFVHELQGSEKGLVQH